MPGVVVQRKFAPMLEGQLTVMMPVSVGTFTAQMFQDAHLRA